MAKTPQQAFEDVDAEIVKLVNQNRLPVRRTEHTTPPPPPPSLRSPPTPPLPDYVGEPADDVSDTGRLSAQTMALEYERTAKTIEATVQELVALARSCDQDCIVVIENNEQIRNKIDTVVNECRQTAAAYREEAKAIFERIQTSSLLADDVRRTMQAAIGRIRAREPLPTLEPDKAAEKTDTPPDKV